jgi:hypothetical protein
MNRRMMRRRGALMGGLAMAATVVAMEAGPAPAQVPDLPEVVSLEGYGPAIYSYADCTDVVYLEEDLLGAFFIDLDEPVEADTELGLTFTGSLAGSLVETPATATIPEGETFAFVEVELVEFETGDLTLTVLPGLDYTAGPEDTTTVEVTDEVYESLSCRDDLEWMVQDGNDRQTIDVGDRPEPLGLFEDVEIIPEEPTDPTDTTTTEVPDTTEPPTTSTSTTTTTTLAPVGRGDERLRAAVRAVPEGFDTPVVGTLPPGLTYVDDEWTGAATTAGTYRFDVRLCVDQTAFASEVGARAARIRPLPRAFPDVLCLGTVDVVIEVEADAVTPPPAGPAAPVRTEARFTG